MDIARTPKKSFITTYRWPMATVTVVLFSFTVMAVVNNSEYSVSAKSLVTAEVVRSDFVLKVRGPGVLKPKDVRWISSAVEGRAVLLDFAILEDNVFDNSLLADIQHLERHLTHKYMGGYRSRHIKRLTIILKKQTDHF
ncbi:MAG: hypothetical protein V2I33_09905 [Kangiellaceae bacterium]|jgi:hypothetical protein|nr:hypothetical protein [Kangiellaceae bacterium]